ncbi:MAG: cytochrome P450, partial [Candidatus Binatia bacterium]
MDFNLMSPVVLENPFPYYAQLRREAPVYWIEPMQAWAISRYEEVFFVLRNPQLFSSAKWWAATAAQDMDPSLEAPHIMASDPPDHTRLRKLANRAFTPRIVATLEPRIREITNDLFDQMASRENLDFMRDLAIPLPVTVIADLLGVEQERREDFRRWTDSFVTTVGGMGTETMNAQARQDLAEFHAYFRHMIEARHKEPKDDLISGMVRAQDE